MSQNCAVHKLSPCCVVCSIFRVALAFECIYRFGPSREAPRFIDGAAIARSKKPGEVSYVLSFFGMEAFPRPNWIAWGTDRTFVRFHACANFRALRTVV